MVSDYRQGNKKLSDNSIFTFRSSKRQNRLPGYGNNLRKWDTVDDLTNMTGDLDYIKENSYLEEICAQTGEELSDVNNIGHATGHSKIVLLSRIIINPATPGLGITTVI